MRKFRRMVNLFLFILQMKQEPFFLDHCNGCNNQRLQKLEGNWNTIIKDHKSLKNAIEDFKLESYYLITSFRDGYLDDNTILSSLLTPLNTISEILINPSKIISTKLELSRLIDFYQKFTDQRIIHSSCIIEYLILSSFIIKNRIDTILLLRKYPNIDLETFFCSSSVERFKKRKIFPNEFHIFNRKYKNYVLILQDSKKKIKDLGNDANELILSMKNINWYDFKKAQDSKKEIKRISMKLNKLSNDLKKKYYEILSSEAFISSLYSEDKELSSKTQPKIADIINKRRRSFKLKNKIEKENDEFYFKHKNPNSSLNNPLYSDEDEMINLAAPFYDDSANSDSKKHFNNNRNLYKTKILEEVD